jgi:hypothetical protein
MNERGVTILDGIMAIGAFTIEKAAGKTMKDR